PERNTLWQNLSLLHALNRPIQGRCRIRRVLGGECLFGFGKNVHERDGRWVGGARAMGRACRDEHHAKRRRPYPTADSPEPFGSESRATNTATAGQASRGFSAHGNHRSSKRL